MIHAYNYVTDIEIQTKLNKQHKFLLIRPTGFGKTYYAASLTEHYYKSNNNIKGTVAFVYATEAVRNQYIRYLNNKINKSDIVFISYMSLSNINNWNNTNNIMRILKNTKLIIFDEAHLMCGENRQISITNIINTLKNIDIFGCTATVERTDYKSVEETFFSSNTAKGYKAFISKYVIDINKCYKLGILTKPIYLSFDILTNLDAGYNKDEFIDLTSVEAEVAKINNINNFIAQALNIRYNNVWPDELTFISFVKEDRGSSQSTLAMTRDKVNKAFNALGYDVVDDLITASNLKGKSVTDAINAVLNNNGTPERKIVRILYSINLLTLGFRVDNLDGIIMLRQTSSNIIYTQQVGRCLSASDFDNKIVLDLVANIDNEDIMARLLHNSINRKGNGNLVKHRVKATANSASKITQINVYSFTPYISSKQIDDIANRLMAIGGKQAKVVFMQQVLSYYNKHNVTMENAIFITNNVVNRRNLNNSKLASIISKVSVDTMVKYIMKYYTSTLEIRRLDIDFIEKAKANGIKYKLI